MKRTVFITVIWLAGALFAGCVAAARNYPLMRPDAATKRAWIDSYQTAPRAFIDPAIQPRRGSLSLLSHLQYTPSQRDQDHCGNCWAWAGTGCLAIALDVQESIKNRLSVQYINNCGTEISCCQGGWLYNVVHFYADVRKAIPWSNTGAFWQDGGGSCNSSCSAISTSPNYPISAISYSSIPTQDVGQTTAINNIKNVLNQGKAIWFGFFMSTNADWVNFENFWSNQPESAIWDFDPTCGKMPDYGSAGHAVLCVGYNDDDPQNRYWIMLNSWGTTSGRPNGLFRIAMDMNYDCSEGGLWGDYNHYWQTLNVTFGGGGAPTPVANPTPVIGPTPPPGGNGDTFGSPLVISANYNTGGSNAEFNDDYQVYNGWLNGETGPDLVYRFTTSGNGDLSIHLTGLSDDLDLILCDGPSTASVYDSSYESGTSEENIIIAHAPAGTYYLVIDGWKAAVSSFSLSISSAAAAPTPIPGPTPEEGLTSYPGDYNGDGYDDIAVFRAANGLWAIRGVSRAYFGAVGDLPVPGDYNGDGRYEAAVFRDSSALWAVRGVTRTYFGKPGDRPVPSDYNGDGTFEPAIYRDGLWVARGVTRSYFGHSGDLPAIR